MELLKYKCLDDQLRPQSSGAPGENRTPTPLRELDFESSASTSSATGALSPRTI